MPTRRSHVPLAGHGSWVLVLGPGSWVVGGGCTFLQPHEGTGPPESPDSIPPTGRQMNAFRKHLDFSPAFLNP